MKTNGSVLESAVSNYLLPESGEESGGCSHFFLSLNSIIGSSTLLLEKVHCLEDKALQGWCSLVIFMCLLVTAHVNEKSFFGVLSCLVLVNICRGEKPLE